MSTLYLLDTGPLGEVTNPRESARAKALRDWLQSMLADGHRVMIPEISDYELRRELIRANRVKGIARLDLLAKQLGFLPIDRGVWLRAAELWAEARNAGQPTAADADLDGDVILAATAQLAGEAGNGAVVITTNVGHLSRFVDAREWESI